ncbi:hypothetical protein B566_EDAN015263 [Ephemera danica]|nr:hypothetical protein B566_EDAN015263 [Ephemera danica]
MQVEALYLTYGIMFGVGASLAYTPSLAILGLHFKKRMGVVNGLVTCGSSVFTIVLPPAMTMLLQEIGVDGTLRVLALAMTFLIVAALLFRVPPGAIPLKPKQPSSEGKKLSLSSIINVEIWRKKRYVIWVLVLPTAMFGYFVPYVHMVKFISLTFPENNGAQLVMCIGVTSGLGRLLFGKISDLPRVDRILLQQV